MSEIRDFRGIEAVKQTLEEPFSSKKIELIHKKCLSMNIDTI